MNKNSQGNTYKTTIKKIWNYISSYRAILVASIFTAAISAITMLYAPILIGQSIDLILGKDNVDFEGITKKLVIVAILVVISALANWFMNIANNKLAYNTIRDIRRDAIEKIEKLPMEFFDGTQAGDVVSRVVSDVDVFANGFLIGLSKFFTGVITIMATLCFMLSINASICIIVVVLTPLSFVVAAFIAKNTHKMFIKQSQTAAEATSFIDEMVGQSKLVKAYNYEEKAVNDFEEINGRLKKYSFGAIIFSSLVNPTTRFLNNVIYAIVALVGSLAVIKGNLTVGGLSIVLSYSMQYAKPFNEISDVVTELAGALASAMRIFDVLEKDDEKADKEGALVLSNVNGNIEIKDLYFSYDKSKKLIEKFNLSVKAGETTAIVGPTGCGKTTFINLLMRFYDADQGSINIDGNSSTEVTRASLRGNFGMVLQDTWLASGTIRENIAMGKPDASFEEVVAAAKAAYADSFIRRLPDGYDTYLSEGGGDLSQGQKQLLCIARIMLIAPPMLILDEATSSIDTRTELKIQAAFAKLMEGRTSFIVAHRLSTIENADQIVVMKDGHILEIGNHKELLSRGGFYSELYNAQFKH